MRKVKSEGKTQELYLCDGNVENCNKKNRYKRGGYCRLTSDINHAIEISQTGTRNRTSREIYLELQTIRKELLEIKKILNSKHVDIYIGKEKMN